MREHQGIEPATHTRAHLVSETTLPSLCPPCAPLPSFTGWVARSVPAPADDTGNLYRTVHWKDSGFGLDGRFTDKLAEAGMWRNDGMNTTRTRSNVVGNPTQWGTPRDNLATL